MPRLLLLCVFPLAFWKFGPQGLGVAAPAGATPHARTARCPYLSRKTAESDTPNSAHHHERFAFRVTHALTHTHTQAMTWFLYTAMVFSSGEFAPANFHKRLHETDIDE